jgi:hypothetical protein
MSDRSAFGTSLAIFGDYGTRLWPGLTDLKIAVYTTVMTVN